MTLRDIRKASLKSDTDNLQVSNQNISIMIFGGSDYFLFRTKIIFASYNFYLIKQITVHLLKKLDVQSTKQFFIKQEMIRIS